MQKFIKYFLKNKAVTWLLLVLILAGGLFSYAKMGKDVYKRQIPAFAQDIPTSKTEQNMDRIERCKKNYTELFGGEALTGQGTDPEMMDILQKFIFGEEMCIRDRSIRAIRQTGRSSK